MHGGCRSAGIASQVADGKSQLAGCDDRYGHILALVTLSSWRTPAGSARRGRQPNRAWIFGKFLPVPSSPKVTLIIDASPVTDACPSGRTVGQPVVWNGTLEICFW